MYYYAITQNNCFSGAAMQDLWEQFEQFHLTTNMRILNSSGQEEKEFAQFLLRVGNGLEGCERVDYSSDETKIQIPDKFISTSKTVREFCTEIFPDIRQVVNLESDDKSWHDWLMERAIICPTNKEVQQINDLVLDEFPGELHPYHSHDTCLTEDQVIGILKL